MPKAKAKPKRTAKRAKTSAPALPFTTEHKSRNVVYVRSPFVTNATWEQWFLLSADRHHDNPFTKQDLEKIHLDEALERNAGIIDVGDFFCAMQGKYDKRSDKSVIRQEHMEGNYLDLLVKTAADFFEPYAHNFIVIGKGNHETEILKKHETDLTERLVATLNDRTGSNIQAGGYGGWVRFLFQSQNGERGSCDVKYYHGTGGGGPVTKGVIQTNRRGVILPNADIILTGHIHEQWVFPIEQEVVNAAGKVETREQSHVCCPTYKDEYGDGYGGWHVERGGPPKPIGAWWLRFYWHRRYRKVLWEFRKAI